MNDLQIPSDLQQMFEDSKLDTTTFVGSDIRTLIVRVAEAESWASRLSAELDKGDSWAWIRSKMEKCRTQFKWYTPRTDSLIGTRYEVMGWLHVLFAHADPKVYIDITIEQQKKADDAEEELKRIRLEHANQCQTIEAYQREVRTLEGNIATWGMVELSVRNPNVQSYIEQLEAGGFGKREFEEDDGKDDSPYGNPQPITRENLIGSLTAAGIELKPEVINGTTS